MSGAVLLCGEECKATRVRLVEEERDVDRSRLHACLLDRWDDGRPWRSRAEACEVERLTWIGCGAALA